MKKVLIAHQSTIPHYRVPFYNALERLRPDTWYFSVVFDPAELKLKRFFKSPLNVEGFKFPLLETNTVAVKISNRTISYQTFWSEAAKYDLVIVGNALNNLTYPLCQSHQLIGTRFAYWGHGRDVAAVKPSLPKRLAEYIKLQLVRRADGFFAYTAGVKSYLVSRGVSPRKVFVVNNTVDISEQRNLFEAFWLERDTIRRQLGVQGKKVLLFVGRATEGKRLDFLMQSFSILQEADPAFHLLLVGSGLEVYSNRQSNNVDALRFLESDDLGRVYVASDLVVYPGTVGLGPLQAFCYDLPIMTVESPKQKPEYEYLSPDNSVVLDSATTPEAYAQRIIDLFGDSDQLKALRETTWSSIKHLTIEQMAQNFIVGVNSILGL